MNNSLSKKLRLIYIPSLICCIGFLFLYTMLNWLLFIRLHVFSLKEEISNFWIPFVLPWIPLYIWFGPRVRLLKFKNSAKDPVMGFIMFLVIWFLAPTLIAQEYLSTASGKLVRLYSVHEIASRPVERYYIFSSIEIDKLHTMIHLTKTRGGKNGQNLYLVLYLVSPLYDKGKVPESSLSGYPIFDNMPLYLVNDKVSDIITINRIPANKIARIDSLVGSSALRAYGIAGKNGVILIKTKDSIAIPHDQNPEESTKIGEDTSAYPCAWLGKKYTQQISNGLSNVEELEKIRSFRDESWRDYAQLSEKTITYFDRIPYSKDYTGYHRAAELSDLLKPGIGFCLLAPQTEFFENRNGNKLIWVFGSFAIGATLFLLMLIFIPIDDAKIKAWLAGERHTEKSGGLIDTIKVFSPHKGFIATPIIFYCNLAVFLAMVVSGVGFIRFEAVDLLAWGGNYGPYTTGGQWWRLITSMFLHQGLMHLLFNMYALLLVGILLEPVLGKMRFVLFYFITGILSGLTSLKIHPDVVSIGASGAIFGMYGVFLSFLLTGVLSKDMKKAFLTSILIFVGFNLFVGLSGNIDNAAHVGGLVSGVLIGFVLSKTAIGKKGNL